MKKNYSAHIELDQALLLATKEFDGDTDYIYRFYESDNDWCFEKLLPGDSYDSFSMTPAPTYAEVFRWLREVHKIDVAVLPLSKTNRTYEWQIISEKHVGAGSKHYDSYEDAEDDALNFVLTSLI